ncbi:hypothetical protein Q5H93_04160 [Hymenobacter sp. ASUV-10]|uniref:Uncharacterized protein n=1 Tax=Hymenobacter aranciens TaxID=3063996 RepID=A0ABT9B6K6_9BACT|nr:hypothetical protein [Hymenobacter sp. ASUV-10]MDO7873916.1 hypothetical protein [Hymenobacter sp. ASUV-10]
MPFNPNTFFVDEAGLPWGLSLDEAAAQLAGRDWWEPYGGWPNLRGACRSVYGLPATACNLRAPASHKPILQVSYELAPPPKHSGPQAVAPNYWVEPLTQLLGPPEHVQKYPGAKHPGSVGYTARWTSGPLQVSLSVFGGIREDEPGGPAAAGLFLDYLDLVALAGPFVEAARVQSAALAAVAGQVMQRQTFTTQREQYPFYLDDYDRKAPAPDAEVRYQAARALYREGLYDTPALLADQLSAQQVLLWAVPGQDTWAVSRKWDTVLLAPSAAPRLELVTLRPARGSGSVMLYVSDLNLSDDYGSPVLAELATAIERATGLTINQYEDYDC